MFTEKQKEKRKQKRENEKLANGKWQMRVCAQKSENRNDRKLNVMECIRLNYYSHILFGKTDSRFSKEEKFSEVMNFLQSPPSPFSFWAQNMAEIA